MGHALSAVTLQASAARRVLGSDQQFVREALAAIEETTRRTVGELDTVLGVLRDGDTPDAAPAPTLAADLDGLLRRTRAAGQPVTATVDAPLKALPPVLSREAYRIVQEGLTNALRHAGAGVTVAVRVVLRDGHLEIGVDNPLAASAATPAAAAGTAWTASGPAPVCWAARRGPARWTASGVFAYGCPSPPARLP